MKAAHKTVLVCALIAALLPLVGWLGMLQVRRDIARSRQAAEAAVTATVSNIAKLEGSARTVQAVVGSVVAPATITVLATNPVQFTVFAMSGWPDVMVYHYDSRTPERGVEHYLF
jgi:hypothetical protein